MTKKAIFDRKNVLVTGGAGFIGSHLCDELVKDNKVICLDNFLTSNERNIDHLLSNPNFIFVRHDINEPINLESLPELANFKIKFQGIQEVYHLACPMSPKNFEVNRLASLLTNSMGTKNALDIALKHEARFLHFSSSVVYGPRRPDNPKIGETDLGWVNMLSKRSAHDEGKRFSETIVANYRDIHKVDAKIMRVFRTYGPRMPLDDNQMIPDFVRDALDGKDLTLLGDEMFSSSFCYVKDVIDAAIKMMQSNVFGPLNIGSDVDLKIVDLARKIIDLVGSVSKINYTEEQLFMTPLCLPDIAKARNELGWMPIVTLEKGLELTVDDLRASKGLKGVSHSLEEYSELE